MTRQESTGCGDDTTKERSGIETGQGCCTGESTSEESTGCGDDSTDGGSSIETQQGCCSGGTASKESTGCGDGTTSDSSSIETQQECCGGETASAESTCSDDASAESSSCCDTGGTTRAAAKGTGVEANRKSPAEYERIRKAAEHTEKLLAEMADAWSPDWAETDVSAFLHDRIRQAGLDAAWSWNHCPAVHAGADAEVGHTLPGDRTVPAGELLHVDFGVAREGYVADLQRVYYYPDEPNEPVPDDLRRAFEDVRAAIDAGREALKPGVRGHEVDAAARAELTDRGWSAFEHAFGHQVGRDAHDGGTLLGPEWNRYGERPRGEVRAGEVYSIELGVGTVYGYVGQEEMVRVVEGGSEFVVEPQTDFRWLERG